MVPELMSIAQQAEAAAISTIFRRLVTEFTEQPSLPDEVIDRHQERISEVLSDLVDEMRSVAILNSLANADSQGAEQATVHDRNRYPHLSTEHESQCPRSAKYDEKRSKVHNATVALDPESVGLTAEFDYIEGPIRVVWSRSTTELSLVIFRVTKECADALRG